MPRTPVEVNAVLHIGSSKAGFCNAHLSEINNELGYARVNKASIIVYLSKGAVLNM